MLAPVMGPFAFAVSAFGANVLAGYLSGQSLKSSLLHAGIGAVSALAGFGAGYGASFIISRFSGAGTLVAFGCSLFSIAGITAMDVFGILMVHRTFDEYDSVTTGMWLLDTVIPFMVGFGAGFAAGVHFFNMKSPERTHSITPPRQMWRDRNKRRIRRQGLITGKMDGM